MPDESDSAPRFEARRGVLKALVVVAALTSWNFCSDVLSDRFELDALGLSSPLRLAMLLLGLGVALGGIVGLGCVVWNRTSLRRLGWTLVDPLRLALLGLAQAGVLVAMVFAAYSFLAGVEGVRSLASSIAAMSIRERVFFFVMGAKVSFVEETVFRGALLQALQRWVGTLGAVLLSAAIFALFHRTLSPVPLFMKFLFGCVLAGFTVRAKSLVPAAIAHTLLWAIVANN